MTFVLQPERKCFPFTCPWMLATVWFSGFAVGIFICGKALPLLLSLMRGMSVGSVSIVGLLLSAGIPILISAFAVIISRPLLLLLVCFCKAIFYLLFSVSLVFYFGEGGWLVQRLLMANEILGLPILYIFWLRCFRHEKLPGATPCMGVVLSEVLVVTFVYRVVAPFLTGLDIL